VWLLTASANGLIGKKSNLSLGAFPTVNRKNKKTGVGAPVFFVAQATLLTARDDAQTAA